MKVSIRDCQISASKEIRTNVTTDHSFIISKYGLIEQSKNASIPVQEEDAFELEQRGNIRYLISKDNATGFAERRG